MMCTVLLYSTVQLGKYSRIPAKDPGNAIRYGNIIYLVSIFIYCSVGHRIIFLVVYGEDKAIYSHQN